MRYVQKIVRNGNSAQVTLPRHLMAWCELILGQAVIVETLEDKSIRIRALRENDLMPAHPPRIVVDAEPPLRS